VIEDAVQVLAILTLSAFAAGLWVILTCEFLPGWCPL
jgi:hypothetical protein